MQAAVIRSVPQPGNSSAGLEKSSEGLRLAYGKCIRLSVNEVDRGLNHWVTLNYLIR